MGGCLWGGGVPENAVTKHERSIWALEVGPDGFSSFSFLLLQTEF